MNQRVTLTPVDSRDQAAFLQVDCVEALLKVTLGKTLVVTICLCDCLFCICVCLCMCCSFFLSFFLLFSLPLPLSLSHTSRFIGSVFYRWCCHRKYNARTSRPLAAPHTLSHRPSQSVYSFSQLLILLRRLHHHQQ